MIMDVLLVNVDIIWNMIEVVRNMNKAVYDIKGVNVLIVWGIIG